MIMMPIALKTLKESQTQEILFRHHQLLTLLFPLFSARNRKSYFLLTQLLAPHFQKGEMGGGCSSRANPFFWLFLSAFLYESMYVYNAQLCVSRSYWSINQVYFPRFLPFPSCDNLQHWPNDMLSCNFKVDFLSETNIW